MKELKVEDDVGVLEDPRPKRVESGEGIESLVDKRDLDHVTARVESGEGIESEGREVANNCASSCVESGEGIESRLGTAIAYVVVTWNPVKELKVNVYFVVNIFVNRGIR